MKNPLIFATLLSFVLFTGCSKNEDKAIGAIIPIPTPTVTPAVIPAPTFKSFYPQSSFLRDTITLFGNNLDKYRNRLRVLFGSVEATIVTVTPTFAKVIVPNELDRASVRIKIGYDQDSLLSAQNFNLTAPKIDSLSCVKGFSGQVLRIMGKGFRLSRKKGQFDLNGIDIEPDYTDADEVSIRIPQGIIAGKYALHVAVAGMKTTAPALFEVIVPEVTSFSPTSGSQNTVVTITGTNLQDINGAADLSVVSFRDVDNKTGSQLAKILSGESEKIRVFVPHLLAGHTYSVKVLVVLGQSISTQTFLYTN